MLCAFLDWTAHFGALQESEFEVKGAGAKDVKETCESQWWQQLAAHVGSDYDVLSVLSMWEIRRSAMHLAVSTLDPCGSSAGVPTLAPAPRIQCGRLCFGGALRAVSSHTLLVRWCTLHGARCMLRRRRLVVLVHKKHVPYVTNVQSSYEATGACKHLTLCHHLAQSCLPFDDTLASLLL